MRLALDSLFIGTWVIFGILISFTLVWVFRWKRKSRLVKRPWWTWLGWGLALIASTIASLWSAYFLGGGAVSWVVPSLATVGVAMYVLWYQQTNQIETVASKGATITTADSHMPNRDNTPKPTSPRLLPENCRQAVVDPNRKDPTLADLTQVINIVSRKLRDKDQVDSIVSISNLGYVRYPTGRADARQLWAAVFEAALDDSPETLNLLLNNIRDSLGTRSKSALEAALREVGPS